MLSKKWCHLIVSEMLHHPYRASQLTSTCPQDAPRYFVLSYSTLHKRPSIPLILCHFRIPSSPQERARHTTTHPSRRHLQPPQSPKSCKLHDHRANGGLRKSGKGFANPPSVHPHSHLHAPHTREQSRTTRSTSHHSGLPYPPPSCSMIQAERQGGSRMFGLTG
jgi:hypothetical protein